MHRAPTGPEPHTELAGYRLWYDLTRLNVALDRIQSDLFGQAAAPLPVRDPEWLRAYA